MTSVRNLSFISPLIAAGMALLSGMAALSCEGLWQRILSNIVGDTVLVSSTVILVFFAALSFGAAFFRNRPMLAASPWLLYGILQLGIAGCLVLSYLFSMFGYSLSLENLSGGMKMLRIIGVAAILVGVPVFLMGGTLLCLIEGGVAKGMKSGVSLLYGVNTIGGTVGIGVVTFYSCYSLGVLMSLTACIGLYAGMGVLGLMYHRFGGRSVVTDTASADKTLTSKIAKPHLPASHQAAAFTIGFVVLGFEYILLLAYAQVGQNSAWSFGAMLILVITCLGIASLLVAVLPFDRKTLLKVMFLATTFGIAAFPVVFYFVTDGLKFESTASGSLSAYMLKLLQTGLLSAGLPLLTAGFVFPLIMETAYASNASGRNAALGRLLCVNALGAVTGIFVVQFVLFPLGGLWGACVAVSMVGLAGCAVLILPWIVKKKRGRIGYAAAMLVCGASGVGVLFVEIPQTVLMSDEQLLELKCGADGLVCIKKDDNGHLMLSHNNHYRLSSTYSAIENLHMGHVPLLLHPDPEETAYIGLATGLTAAAAVKHSQVKEVTVLELSSSVITLSLKHFGKYTDDFHRDPRVSIEEADGVHYFASTDRKFDVVTGDLFFPWQKGASRLFSREHFLNVRSALEPGGVFCQWLPNWQLGRESLHLIAGTFASVFPHGILVHLPFNDRVVVGLVGRNSDAPVDASSLNTLWQARREEMAPGEENRTLPSEFTSGMYRGAIAENVPKTSQYNTMDKPILEPVVIRLEPTL